MYIQGYSPKTLLVFEHRNKKQSQTKRVKTWAYKVPVIAQVIVSFPHNQETEKEGYYNQKLAIDTVTVLILSIAIIYKRIMYSICDTIYYMNRCNRNRCIRNP